MTIFNLLCQHSKSSYNINADFDCSIIHIMQYIMYLQKLYQVRALRSVPDKLFTKGLFMKFNGSVSLKFIE